MELNLPNLKTLRDTIQALDPTNFDMAAWSRDENGDGMATRVDMVNHTCGTAGCIGGWAEVLFVAKDDDRIGEAKDEEVAEALGLTEEQAHNLFFPLVGIKEAGIEIDSYTELTQAQAVQVLDHLMETGEVDWPRFVQASTNA